jgi:NTP pyrophosphatase (non-canonical NTP hydrolase)
MRGRNVYVREFQDMMRRIYFHRDSERGAVGTFDWLVEEVEELGEALKEKNKKAMEDEFADVFAWLASLANVVNVDLEKAAITKYDNRCPKCGQTSCKCSF